jgi:uncharacterized protein
VFDNSRGGRSGSDAGLDHLRDTKTIVLTTFKRDGTPVPTPVSIAFDGSRAFFRSYHKAWKTKRLSRNPEVEVTPSNVSGKVTGPSVRAWAKLLDDQQSRVAARALAVVPEEVGSSGPPWRLGAAKHPSPKEDTGWISTLTRRSA